MPFCYSCFTSVDAVIVGGTFFSGLLFIPNKKIIRVSTNTIRMVPSITFINLFNRLFLIDSSSLMDDNFLLIRSRSVVSVSVAPSKSSNGTSKTSANLCKRSASGTENPFSHFETV